MTGRPSRHVDEVINAIDVGLQNSHVYIMTLGDPQDCWRCQSLQADPHNEVGLCDPCFEDLRS